ncbi:hypothetical protein F1559_005079 [Cyanidiococcus yangmingshanensis]|uniref:Uncharacterized protein n=1 Tax=Cyanidiococcus yangmingshanensis TaxID=2690220 RepID=A0A7J7IQT1_9RHOD|nr:hypothetical protein F1559_005079 [Cyanidiococcus yangmingshanensis]
MQRAFDTLDRWCAQPRCISDLYHSGFLFYGFVAWWSFFGIAALVYSLVPVSRTFRECLSSSQRAEWISRVVSNVNALVMVSVSSVLLQQVWSAELQHGPSGPVLPHAASFYISHALLLCYFCYDASLILLFPSFNILTVVIACAPRLLSVVCCLLLLCWTEAAARLHMGHRNHADGDLNTTRQCALVSQLSLPRALAVQSSRTWNAACVRRWTCAVHPPSRLCDCPKRSLLSECE